MQSAFLNPKAIILLNQSQGILCIDRDIKKKLFMFYTCTTFLCRAKVDPKFRSRTNVVLRIGTPKEDEDLEKKFIDEAAKLGFISLKGHR